MAVIIDGGDTAAWVEAAALRATEDVPVVCVVPVRTNTRYWHDHILTTKKLKCSSSRVG